MKVLYVITKANWGGAQRYVFDLARAAHHAGHDTAVVFGAEYRFRDELSDQLREEGVRGIPIDSLGRDVHAGSDLTAYKDLVRIFRKERPDIVHLNSSKAGILGTLAARRAGIRRIIFTAHGWAFNEARPWWQKIIFKLIYAFIVYGTTRTICVSEAVRNDMRWLPFTGKKLVLIHNGVHCGIHMNRQQARAAALHRGVDDSEMWIGMISELHPTKRIEDAIDAMKIVHASHPEVKLAIIGDGELKNELYERIIDTGMEGIVLLSGFLLNASQFLSAFDLFLHASQSEALGLAILEAGCASLPTVATNVGGIPEIITDGESGLLVPPRRPDLIAKALITLIEDPDRATRMGEALHARVLKDFTREAMIEKTFALYDR